MEQPEAVDDADPLLLALQEPESGTADANIRLGEAIDYTNADELLKEFYAEVREVDRDNEVNRILGAFKLNPYEQLGLRFDAAVEEVNRHYRKTSLLVHPDKCSHPRAKDAFDALRQAQQALLNEEKKLELDRQLTYVRELVREERKKSTKHDSAVRVASMMHEDGRAGVEAAWEGTDEFHHLWKLKSRDVLAKSEWRRRKLTKRIKDEEGRIESEEKEEKDFLQRLRDHEKGWEKTRESRVGTWRDFVKKKEGSGEGKSGKTKKRKLAMGGIKPPKQKTWDEEKTYVQRPVGEQFRPPPPVAPKPHRE